MTAPAPSSDAFLSGQGIPVDLGRIETALADLWGPAAEREGGPDVDRPAVTRVSLANLVVVDLGGALSEEILDTVVARYPCRAVVVTRDDSLGRKVAAEISAVCHLPAPGLPQVCSERIVLRAGADGLDLVPGAVRPILEADLPQILWWSGDPRDALPLYRELSSESGRVVPDLPDPGADPESVRVALDPSINPFARDLAWFGATRWRELTAGFFDTPGQESRLRRVKSVSITSEADRAGELPRVSAWLAGWLAGQLGWVPSRHDRVAPGRSVARFSAPSGEVAVTFSTDLDESAKPARIASVSLVAADEGGSEVAFRLVRIGEDVAVEVEDAGQRRLPRMVRAAEFTVPDRVSAALESARDDPPYRKALPNVLWLLSGGVAV